MVYEVSSHSDVVGKVNKRRQCIMCNKLHVSAFALG
jgi:hypothetical protein